MDGPDASKHARHEWRRARSTLPKKYFIIHGNVRCYVAELLSDTKRVEDVDEGERRE